MKLAQIVRWFDVSAVVMHAWAPAPVAQARVEINVVYGMYSGLALLMDVHGHRPGDGSRVSDFTSRYAVCDFSAP